MNKRIFAATATLIISGFGLSACTGEPDDPVEASEAAPPADAPAASLPRTESAARARVFFISPADGATVSNPVTVEFGIEGMSVVKAGNPEAHSGHHHLIIDAGLPDLALPIPADEHYIHFGDASQSTELTLTAGTHTLQLLLGDHLHIPHDPPVFSDPISIVVE